MLVVYCILVFVTYYSSFFRCKPLLNYFVIDYFQYYFSQSCFISCVVVVPWSECFDSVGRSGKASGL